MEQIIERLLPALRQLQEDGDVHDALRLVEAIHDVAAGVAGVETAATVMHIGDGFEDGPAAAPLGCFSAARMLFARDGVEHGIGGWDVLAAGIIAESGEREQAVDLYERGLPLLDTSVDAEMVGRGWHNYGIQLRKLGRAAESLAAQEKALDAYRKSNRATPTADCHVGAGIALHDLGRPGDALEPYAAARALYTEFGEDALLADVDDRRGLALCDLGRFEEAEAAHAAAIARYRGAGENALAPRSQRYRSHPLVHAGRAEEAVAELGTAGGVRRPRRPARGGALRCSPGRGADRAGPGGRRAVAAGLGSAGAGVTRRGPRGGLVRAAARRPSSAGPQAPVAPATPV